MISRFSSLQARLDQSFLADRLLNARSYKRISGYFRSSILELVGEELESIEDVRIICNSELDPIDINVSKAVREAALKEKWNQLPLGTESLQFAGKYLKLYKLLTSGKVKIKVVPKETVFVHGKAGIIEMSNGEKTSFIGSANDSKRGFAISYEMIWEDRSPEAVAWTENEFETLWAMGHDLPDAIITEVRRVAERVEITFPGFKDLKPQDIPASAMVESPIYRGGEQLQPWQRSFVSTFLQHREVYGKARLLIADEVGLGKTLSMATAALVSSLLDDGNVLILCPKTLIYQWQAELNDRLGVVSGVWKSQTKEWIDPQGRAIRTRGPEDVVRCPFQVAIVSTGLIVAGSAEADFLKSARTRVGTLILDEAHKARIRGSLGSKEEEPNKLLEFMQVAAGNARHVILGTATPIQTDVRELWDLMGVLSVNADFVMGSRLHSKWRQVDKVQDLLSGKKVVTDESTAWDLIRSPLTHPDAPMLDTQAKRLLQSIRCDLSLSDEEVFTSQSHTALDSFTRSGDFSDVLGTDFFRRNNPFIRHIVLRRRKPLEEAGLLDRIAVDVHPDPVAPAGTYKGVSFSGLGLVTIQPFERAYLLAEEFVDKVSSRAPATGLLRSIFLQRICSSFVAGRLTVQRILDKQRKPLRLLPMDTIRGSIADKIADKNSAYAVDDAFDFSVNENDLSTDDESILKNLEDDEIEILVDIKNILSMYEASDPKLNAVKWFLSEYQSPRVNSNSMNNAADAGTWADMGCIVFSQYFDTVNWIAKEIAAVYPEEIVAVYAGAGKSGLYKGDRFISEERDTIKRMVKERTVKILIATDAACEGLNLQTLGTMINVDLPWNPSRLEQRLGRIKRFGQCRDTVDMLNLVYKDTRDEKVYSKLSARMKDRFDILGGIPDCLDDEWISDLEEFEKKADTYLHLRNQSQNIFDEKCGIDPHSDDNRWEECTRVLSRRDIEQAMARPW